MEVPYDWMKDTTKFHDSIGGHGNVLSNMVRQDIEPKLPIGIKGPRTYLSL